MNSRGTQRNVHYTGVQPRGSLRFPTSRFLFRMLFTAPTEIPNWLAKFLWLLAFYSIVSFNFSGKLIFFHLAAIFTNTHLMIAICKLIGIWPFQFLKQSWLGSLLCGHQALSALIHKQEQWCRKTGHYKPGKTHAWPPSLASNWIMHQTSKSDLIDCLAAVLPMFKPE